MPRQNLSVGKRFAVTLSDQSIRLLNDLAKQGIYGRSASEVGGRFIDEALQRFAEPPRFPSTSLSEPRNER